MRRVFIYGGCTSRDAVDYYGQYDLVLHSYIARQSLISAFRPANPKLFSISDGERPFQRRMLQGDIIGSMPKHLAVHRHEIDLIIWDLMIERVGVRVVGSGGMVTQNGARLAESAPHDSLKGAYKFGTDAHLRQWVWALDRFGATLDHLGLKSKVIVNATPWAFVDAEGNPAQSNSQLTPEWFNENVVRYWHEIEKRGIKVARVAQADAVADPGHKWGPAYFHYMPVTYQAQLKAITELI